TSKSAIKANGMNQKYNIFPLLQAWHAGRAIAIGGKTLFLPAQNSDVMFERRNKIILAGSILAILGQSLDAGRGSLQTGLLDNVRSQIQFSLSVPEGEG